MKIATPEVMLRIQQVIKMTDTPSWLNSVPHNFGDTKAGMVKADEWHNLSTIFLPIALISMWGEGSSHPSPEIATNFGCILNHTMLLVSVVSLACMRTMTATCSAAYLEYMTQYIRDFLIIHAVIKPRPNMHMAMHIPHFLRLFALFDPGGVFFLSDSSANYKGCSVTTLLVFIYFPMPPCV
jgi:hypothetical protein